jgi:hypothetical protein
MARTPRIPLDSFFFIKDGYAVRPSAFGRKTDRNGVTTTCDIMDASSSEVIAHLTDDPCSIVARVIFASGAARLRFLEAVRKSPCAVGHEGQEAYLLSEYARQITMQADEAWMAFLTKRAQDQGPF